MVSGITDFIDGQDNVFAFNVAGKTVSLVSAKAPGLFTTDNNINANNSFSSSSASLSDNGRYLAFQSGANDLLGNLPDSPSSVFAKDVQKGLPILIATSSSAPNDQPVISGDGSTVAFQSRKLLTKNDISGGAQIFTASNWQAGNPTFTLVSVDSAGTNGGNQSSENPSISANGQVVAFDSAANNLVKNDPNAKQYKQIFVNNLGTKTTTLVSSNSSGTDGGNNGSNTPILSADGSTVIYNSTAANLLSGVSVPTNSSGKAFQNVYAYVASALPNVSSSATYTNISSDLQVTSSGLTYNPSTQEYAQTLILTNTSQLTFGTGIALVLKNLSSNATLADATGSTNGSSYLDLETPAGGLKHGQSISVTLSFDDPTGKAITYNTEELEGQL